MKVTITRQRFATRVPFVISRGTKTHADQILVELEHRGHVGLGASVPYGRYGETLDSVETQVKDIIPTIEGQMSIEDCLTGLQNWLPAGSARNAVDCALWDLLAQASKKPVWDWLDIDSPSSRYTALTLSIDTPEIMADTASAYGSPLLKLKIAGDQQDVGRIQSVLSACPDAQLILDANEALDLPALNTLLEQIDNNSIALIEQPVPQGQDELLKNHPHRDKLCADESFHTKEDIASLAPFYGATNIKLDKTGGLSEAILAIRKAKQEGLKVMLGCMLGSSRAMAPAFMLESLADYLDLDGPALLVEDDADGFTIKQGIMHPVRLWGFPRESAA